MKPATSQGRLSLFMLIVCFLTNTNPHSSLFSSLLVSSEPDSPFSKMVPAMKDSSESCSALQAYSARAFLPTILQTRGGWEWGRRLIQEGKKQLFIRNHASFRCVQPNFKWPVNLQTITDIFFTSWNCFTSNKRTDLQMMDYFEYESNFTEVRTHIFKIYRTTIFLPSRDIFCIPVAHTEPGPARESGWGSDEHESWKTWKWKPCNKVVETVSLPRLSWGWDFIPI